MTTPTPKPPPAPHPLDALRAYVETLGAVALTEQSEHQRTVNYAKQAGAADALALATSALAPLVAERDDAISARDEWCRQCNFASEEAARFVARNIQLEKALAALKNADSLAEYEAAIEAAEARLAGAPPLPGATREEFNEAIAQRDRALAQLDSARHEIGDLGAALAAGAGAPSPVAPASETRGEILAIGHQQALDALERHAPPMMVDCYVRDAMGAIRHMRDAARGGWQYGDGAAPPSERPVTAEARLAGGPPAERPVQSEWRTTVERSLHKIEDAVSALEGAELAALRSDLDARAAPPSESPDELRARRRLQVIEPEYSAIMALLGELEVSPVEEIESLRADRELLRAWGEAAIAAHRAKAANEATGDRIDVALDMIDWNSHVDAGLAMRKAESRGLALALAAQGRGKGDGT